MQIEYFGAHIAELVSSLAKEHSHCYHCVLVQPTRRPTEHATVGRTQPFIRSLYRQLPALLPRAHWHLPGSPTSACYIRGQQVQKCTTQAGTRKVERSEYKMVTDTERGNPLLAGGTLQGMISRVALNLAMDALSPGAATA